MGSTSPQCTWVSILRYFRPIFFFHFLSVLSLSLVSLPLYFLFSRPIDVITFLFFVDSFFPHFLFSPFYPFHLPFSPLKRRSTGAYPMLHIDKFDRFSAPIPLFGQLTSTIGPLKRNSYF